MSGASQDPAILTKTLVERFFVVVVVVVFGSFISFCVLRNAI